MSFTGAFDGSFDSGESGTPTNYISATLEQIVTNITYTRAATFEQRMFEQQTLTATIEQDIHGGRHLIAATLEQRLFEAQTLTATIESQVTGTVSGSWAPVVTLDGVDVTDQITERIRIVTDENASKIAQVALVPDSGTIDLLGYVGQLITIDYSDNGWMTRRYTGIVSTPTYDVAAGLIRLDCTTDLQGALKDQTRANIEALIGGYWSADVFEDNADGWQYAQDRLSTVAASLWVDGAGTLNLADWAAKTTPDFTLDAGDYIHGTLEVSHAAKNDMVNRVYIEFDYRFPRLRQRHIGFNLRYTGQWCTFLRQGFTWPSREMIRSAAQATTWETQDIVFIPLPPPGAYNCDGDAGGTFTIVWGFDPNWNGLIHEATQDYIDAHCMGADFTLSKRWAQSVTEQYVLDVTGDNSIDTIGERGVLEAYGLKSEYDTSRFTEETGYSGYEAGGSIDTNGDWIKEPDTTRRTAMEAAQETVLNKAKAEILRTHRLTDVKFTIPMRPNLDLSKTVQITTTPVTAKGKVRTLEEILDIETGNCVQVVTLAISRHGGAGVITDDPLDPVAQPSPDNGAAYELNQYLSFHIGGTTDAPAFDETWSGMITNYDYDPDTQNPVADDPNDSETVIYPESFIVDTPEIEAGAVDAVDAAGSEVFQVDIPEDTLTLAI